MTSLVPAPETVKEAVKVTAEDQDGMCEYGALVFQKPQIEAEISGLKNEHRPFSQTYLERLEDTEEPIMLADEDDKDALKVRIGDGFVMADASFVEEHVEEKKRDAVARLLAAEKRLEELAARKKELRTRLKSRLGDSIGLDDE